MLDSHDPFDETSTTQSDEANTEAAIETKTQEPAEEKAETETQKEETGDNNSEPPSETSEGTTEKPAEKLIPESRFKAALKDATDRMEKLQQENASLKAVPAPDKNTDPEAYILHMKIETSKAVMRKTHKDYDTVIAHYQEMAKVNPYLNQAVVDADIPAQYAYEVAKQDLELNDLRKVLGSDEWKQFQEWRKSKEEASEEKLVEQKPAVAKQTGVPNLNRSTGVSKSAPVSDDTDALFAGAL